MPGSSFGLTCLNCLCVIGMIQTSRKVGQLWDDGKKSIVSSAEDDLKSRSHDLKSADSLVMDCKNTQWITPQDAH